LLRFAAAEQPAELLLRLAAAAELFRHSPAAELLLRFAASEQPAELLLRLVAAELLLHSPAAELLLRFAAAEQPAELLLPVEVTYRLVLLESYAIKYSLRPPWFS